MQFLDSISVLQGMTVYIKLQEKRIKCLENDICNLIKLIRRLQRYGCWFLEGLHFEGITYEDLFGDCLLCTSTKGCKLVCTVIMKLESLLS